MIKDVIAIRVGTARSPDFVGVVRADVAYWDERTVAVGIVEGYFPAVGAEHRVVAKGPDRRAICFPVRRP